MTTSPASCTRLGFAGSLLALALAAGSLVAAPGQTPAVGDTFPALSAFDLEGPLPDLSQAKVIVVDFWASWCGPCKASFPVYDQLQAEYGTQGVVIIAVNVDQDAKTMEKFIARHKPGFVILRDAHQKLVQAVAPPTMPTSFILDARGIVRAVHTGFHGEKTKQAYVEDINLIMGGAR